MANPVEVGNPLPGLEQPFEAVCDSDDRERWLQERRTGIGSSDAAIVLGVYPWKTRLELYADKLGLTEDTDAGEAAYWGTKIEPLVLARFAAETGRKTFRAGTLLRSKARPFQLATLDGTQVTDRGVGNVEVKCTSLEDRWEDGIPAYVYAQVQHQLAVTGRDYGSVAVLFKGRAFFWNDVERDGDFIGELTRMEMEFWNRVADLDPPSPEGSEADRKIIAKLFPKDVDPAPVLLDGEFITMDERLCELKADAKKIDHEIGYIENELRMAIGDHAEAALPNGVRFTNKSQHRKEYVVQAADFRVLRRVERKGAR